MFDYADVVVVAASAFFATLSFGLLLRYRELSRRIAASSDLGRDLWQALERRMKKQDERILDLMGSLEILQGRMGSVHQQTSPTTSVKLAPSEGVDARVQVNPVQGVVSISQPPPSVSQESRNESRDDRQPILDETQKAAISLLRDGPIDTIQIRDGLRERVGVESREHAARVMKELFERGLVVRDARKKPFIYQLTDQGRRYL